MLQKPLHRKSLSSRSGTRRREHAALARQMRQQQRHAAWHLEMQLRLQRIAEAAEADLARGRERDVQINALLASVGLQPQQQQQPEPPPQDFTSTEFAHTFEQAVLRNVSAAGMQSAAWVARIGGDGGAMHPLVDGQCISSFILNPLGLHM